MTAGRVNDDAGAILRFDETLAATCRKYVVNFPTKRDWRTNSRYEDIESGLKVLEAEVRRLTRLSCVGIGWSLACG